MTYLVVLAVIFIAAYLWFKKRQDDKPKPGEKVLKPGGFFGNIRISIDDNFVRYRGAYGDNAVVPIKNITAITTSPNGFGKSDVIFVGSGTELARISKLPTSWAEKTMMWLITELKL